MLYSGPDAESLGAEGQYPGGDRKSDVGGLPADTGHLHVFLVSDDLSPTTGSGNLPAVERGGRLLYRRPSGADLDGPTQLLRGGQTAQT